MTVPRPAALLLLALSITRPAAGQRPTPDTYLSHLPPLGRIVGQTEASERLRLFGDPGAPDYRDEAPRDGVDDARGRRLLALAEHFSPILRRNTDQVPRAVESLVGDRFLLNADTWRDGRRTGTTVIDLGPPREVEAGNGAYRSAHTDEDARLDSLVRALLPHRDRPAVVSPGGEEETVLYVDLPGDGERTWRLEHRKRPKARSRAYVHPFIHDVGPSAEGNVVELVLQYWFFYPYNDGANNHEGDWEHVSVSVTTAERARHHGSGPHDHGALVEADVAAILAPVDPTPLDSLRIRYVSYYFHNNAMVLDYLAVAAGERVFSRTASSEGAHRVWEDTSYMEAAIRRRVALAGGRLATHPVGYIGGNNKGMDELLQVRPRFLGSFNRDSHGTYPFPGVWRKVGPLDATEKIYGDVVPALRLDAAGHPDPALPWYDLIADERYLTYRAEDLILLPDWERLVPLVLSDPAARRRWAWFVLPVRMGFPAAPSPGAGALSRVDLGNVAPAGPAYNDAWNRPGITTVYREYTPTVLRVALAPITPLASLQSGWGVLNYPLVLWGLMPGGNVAVTQLLPWATGGMHLLGAPPAKTFYLGELPRRFTGLGVGAYRQFGGTDFARLLPSPADLSADGLRAGRRTRSDDHGARVWLNLYYGPRLSVENTFSLGSAEVSYPLLDDGDRVRDVVRGTLRTRELTGGLTYRIPPVRSETARLYARGGYAYTDYEVERLALAGGPIEAGARSGGYMMSLLPSRRWWPNTGYAGLGLELFSPPDRWLLRRLGYGVRLEAGGLLHRLDADDDCADCHVTAERGDAALLIHFSW